MAQPTRHQKELILCGCASQWRHNERDGVSIYRRLGCLIKRLFRRRWNETSLLRIIGLSFGYIPAIGEFPAQRASNVENVSISRGHHMRLMALSVLNFILGRCHIGVRMGLCLVYVTSFGATSDKKSIKWRHYRFNAFHSALLISTRN